MSCCPPIGKPRRAIRCRVRRLLLGGAVWKRKDLDAVASASLANSSAPGSGREPRRRRTGGPVLASTSCLRSPARPVGRDCPSTVSSRSSPTRRRQALYAPVCLAGAAVQSLSASAWSRPARAGSQDSVAVALSSTGALQPQHGVEQCRAGGGSAARAVPITPTSRRSVRACPCRRSSMLFRGRPNRGPWGDRSAMSQRAGSCQAGGQDLDILDRDSPMRRSRTPCSGSRIGVRAGQRPVQAPARDGAPCATITSAKARVPCPLQSRLNPAFCASSIWRRRCRLTAAYHWSRE